MRPVSLTEAELRELLRRGEGQFLEFKSVWDQATPEPRLLSRRTVRDMIAESVAAFANADGGLLLLGVEDDGTPSGHAFPAEAVEEFFAVPRRRLQPPVSCRVAGIRIDGHEILVFDVVMSDEAVMVGGNGFPYRAGDRTIREPQEVINGRKEAYRRVGYEQRVRPEATLEHLDLDLAREFLSRAPYRDRPLEEQLEQYGLIQRAATGWRITNAALLLFAKPPFARWHPRAGMRLFRVEGRERRHGPERNVTQIERVDRPIAQAIGDAYKLARAQIRRSEKLHDLFFREVPEYPEFAWQEAIVNAFAHRDYELQGREVEVWFYSDRLEVSSPGELVPPVTIEALRSRRPVHASRNPLLVRVLADVGIMRDEGEGIPRMFEEMERSFLREPELDVADGAFVVRLFNEPVFEGPSPAWQRLVGELPISTAQKRVLLAHPGGFTNEDYRKLNEVDRDEAYRQIQELVALGILQSARAPGRGAVYRVSPDLRSARAFLESRLPRLQAFFADQERLQNAQYRELFGVTRYTAVRELGRLVEEGFLRLRGERRGAHYVPGPKLGGSRK